MNDIATKKREFAEKWTKLHKQRNDAQAECISDLDSLIRDILEEKNTQKGNIIMAYENYIRWWKKYFNPEPSLRQKQLEQEINKQIAISKRI